MGRHNRRGHGRDQLGFRYQISYAPDWLERIQVTRSLPSGRYSTRTIFKNPVAEPADLPDRVVRTSIRCPDQDLDVRIAVQAGSGHAEECKVRWCGKAGGDRRTDCVTFTLRSLPGGAKPLAGGAGVQR